MAVTDRPRTLRDRPRTARTAAVGTRRGRARTSRIVVNVGLLLFSVVYLLPLLWMLLASVNAHATFELSVPSPTTENFHHILNHDTTYQPMLNGLLLCGGGTLVCVVCSL